MCRVSVKWSRGTHNRRYNHTHCPFTRVRFVCVVLVADDDFFWVWLITGRSQSRDSILKKRHSRFVLISRYHEMVDTVTLQ